MTLNGKPLTDWKIRHADIMAGGELVFEMTNDSTINRKKDNPDSCYSAGERSCEI